MTKTLEPEQLEDAIDEKLDEQSAENLEQPAEEEQSETAATEPISQSDLESEHYQAILEKAEEVGKANYEWSVAKEQAAELKKRFDRLDGEMLALIQRGPERQRPLPFSDGEEAQENEEWKEFGLGSLDISESIAAKLVDEGIETLGQLQEYLADKPLTSIKGIGAEKAAAVADAFADFWTTHPEFCEAEESEEPDSEVEDEVDEEAKDEGAESPTEASEGEQS